jgi:hypothetical protein
VTGKAQKKEGGICDLSRHATHLFESIAVELVYAPARIALTSGSGLRVSTIRPKYNR